MRLNEKMKAFKNYFLFVLFSLSVLLSTVSYGQTGDNKTSLVPIGGGKISGDLISTILSVRALENPKVIIIPHAATANKINASAEKNLLLFKENGVEDLAILDLSNPQKALEDIEKADIIWMPGGGQGRLIKALDKANVTDAIRLKYKEGALIGGTSAGASIMSDVMMLNSKRDKNGVLIPTLSYGLKLWPEVIIDQHFSERKRLARLEIAVQRHPHLIGIGLDEGTGVVYEGKSMFYVVGKGTVTVLYAENPNAQNLTLKKMILFEGDSFDSDSLILKRKPIGM